MLAPAPDKSVTGGVGPSGDAVFFRVEGEGERGCDECEDDGVYDKHGECARVEDASGEADVQDDEFDKSVYQTKDCVSGHEHYVG